jgi:hypothetical protein
MLLTFHSAPLLMSLTPCSIPTFLMWAMAVLTYAMASSLVAAQLDTANAAARTKPMIERVRMCMMFLSFEWKYGK